MGKKLGALFRRNPKTPKVKTLANIAIARTTILKNQRQVRCSHARSDVAQLLNLGHQDRALLRVEHVIREQNMLDVLVMIENYCYILVEGVGLVENSRECPEELNEAISSLMFAASRCGELPELQEIRGILTSKYGKEFVAHSVELRNNCSVNPKMVQKLSTRQASLETRQSLLKQIASANGINLHLEDEEDYDFTITEEKQNIIQEEKHLQPREVAAMDDPELRVDAHGFAKDMRQDEKFSESMQGRRKYKDVADAAREAFESAAYAAAAARAAVELSRYESRDEDPNDHDSSNHKPEVVFTSGQPSKSKLEIKRDAATEGIKPSDKILHLNKIHPNDGYSSESEDEYMVQNSSRSHVKHSARNYKKEEIHYILSSSSSDNDSYSSESEDEYMVQNSSRSHVKHSARNYKKEEIHYILSSSSSDREADNKYDGKVNSNEDIVFDESDDETRKSRDRVSWLKSNSPINEFRKTTRHRAVADENFSDKKVFKLHWESPKRKPLKFQADHMARSTEDNSRLGSTHSLSAEKHLYSPYSNTKPNSTTGRQTRTRWD